MTDYRKLSNLMTNEQDPPVNKDCKVVDSAAEKITLNSLIT